MVKRREYDEFGKRSTKFEMSMKMVGVLFVLASKTYNQIGKYKNIGCQGSTVIQAPLFSPLPP